MKISANWAAFQALAPDRFDAFKRPGDADELAAISRYVWNMAVCSTLQPGFHAVEVAFRNQVHNALTTLHGPTWYDTPGLLTGSELVKVADAKRTLTGQGRPLDPGRVVAELHFGFWTRLYGAHHEQNIIRPTIHLVCPLYTGTQQLRRAVVATPLRNIRLLRNRVSHHEPVVFDPQLPTYHHQIIELVVWMNPQMADLTAIVDNFLAIYGKTWKGYLPIVETMFG
ncbi:MAG: hypothetical protein ACO1SV_15315 [Fimbriimonas sp.]